MLIIIVINSCDHINWESNQDYDLRYKEVWMETLTGTEDAQLLSGWYKVEMCCEEVHKRTGIHHKHEHPEAIHTHLLPEGTLKIYNKL